MQRRICQCKCWETWEKLWRQGFNIYFHFHPTLLYLIAMKLLLHPCGPHAEDYMQSRKFLGMEWARSSHLNLSLQNAILTPRSFFSLIWLSKLFSNEILTFRFLHYWPLGVLFLGSKVVSGSWEPLEATHKSHYWESEKLKSPHQPETRTGGGWVTVWRAFL